MRKFKEERGKTKASLFCPSEIKSYQYNGVSVHETYSNNLKVKAIIVLKSCYRLIFLKRYNYYYIIFVNLELFDKSSRLAESTAIVAHNC